LSQFGFPKFKACPGELPHNYSGIATHGAGAATHVDTVDLYR
jgi:hypothetical protein